MAKTVCRNAQHDPPPPDVGIGPRVGVGAMAPLAVAVRSYQAVTLATTRALRAGDRHPSRGVVRRRGRFRAAGSGRLGAWDRPPPPAA